MLNRSPVHQLLCCNRDRHGGRYYGAPPSPNPISTRRPSRTLSLSLSHQSRPDGESEKRTSRAASSSSPPPQPRIPSLSLRNPSPSAATRPLLRLRLFPPDPGEPSVLPPLRRIPIRNGPDRFLAFFRWRLCRR